MKTSIAQRLDSVQRKMLPGNSESVGKKVPGMDDEGREDGRLVARSLEIARRTQQELAAALGHTSQSHVSGYINGSEPTPWRKLMRVLWFKCALGEALLEDAPGVKVRRVVEIAS